jgi:transposase
LAAALANKLARIAWTVLAQERSYEARVTKAGARPTLRCLRTPIA